MGWGEARRDHATKPTEHHLRANGKSDTDCKSRNRHCKRNGHTSCTQSTHGAASAGRNWRGKNWMGGRARAHAGKSARTARARDLISAREHLARNTPTPRTRSPPVYTARADKYFEVSRECARESTRAPGTQRRASLSPTHTPARAPTPANAYVAKQVAQPFGAQAHDRKTCLRNGLEISAEFLPVFTLHG